MTTGMVLSSQPVRDSTLPLHFASICVMGFLWLESFPFSSLASPTRRVKAEPMMTTQKALYGFFREPMQR